jgi:hypothetical protein
MKKPILLIFTALLAIITLESFEAGKRRDGTDPGHTGSPGDSLKTCIVCHGGVNEFQAGWISSNIPESGFEPGKTYNITATNTNIGYNIFGFQVSPQAKDGKLLGEIIVTNKTETKLVGDNKYITYTVFGVDGQDSKSWSFDWKAPDETVNEVTFYGAFNSNMDGHKFSDKTTTTNLRVFRKGFTSVKETQTNISNWIAYKPFGSNQIHLNGHSNENGLMEVTLYNLQGQKTWSKSFLVQTGKNNISEEITELPAGIFVLNFNLNGSNLTKKVYLP